VYFEYVEGCSKGVEMARIGIITDIHNNAAALKAILEELEKRKCDEIICCGDIIGIGAYPEETVQIMRNLDNLSACVKGNHETFLFGKMPTTFPNEEHMEYGERQYHLWEHERLGEDSVRFLETLSYSQTIEREGRKIYVAHYSMDEQKRYVNYHQNPTEEQLKKMFEGIDADIILYGHDHVGSVMPGDDALKRPWYINCGSLGCPARDKNIARAGILDLEEKIRYESVWIPYDVETVLRDIDLFNFPDKENIKQYFYGVENPQ